MLTTKLIRSGLIVALAASAPAVAPAQEKLGIRYGNETIYEESLPAPLRQQLFALETELNKRREQLLDQFVVKRYLAERAEIEGRTVTELEAELLSVEAPDEVTVRHTYDNNWQQIPGEYEQVRDELALNIQEQLRSRKLDDLLAQIRASKDYEVILPDSDQPVYPVTTEGYPFKGPADAKVTVALFAHFQCPPCNAAISLIDRLPEELIGQSLIQKFTRHDNTLRGAGPSA